MKIKIVYWLIIVTTSVFVTSCFKQYDLNDQESAFIFQISDIKGLDLSHYNISKFKNGKDYYYNKNNSELNGSSYYFGMVYTNNLKQKIKITTFINIQSSEKRAKDLYKYSEKIPLLDKTNYYKIKKSELDIDEGNFIKINDFYTISLRKSKLYYSIQLELYGNKQLNWGSFKENLIKKYKNFIELNKDKL